MENTLERIANENEDGQVHKGLGVDYGLIVGTEMGGIYTTNGQNLTKVLEYTPCFDEKTGRLYTELEFRKSDDALGLEDGYCRGALGFKLYFDKENEELKYFDSFRGICKFPEEVISNELKLKEISLEGNYSGLRGIISERFGPMNKFGEIQDPISVIAIRGYEEKYLAVFPTDTIFARGGSEWTEHGYGLNLGGKGPELYSFNGHEIKRIAHGVSPQIGGVREENRDVFYIPNDQSVKVLGFNDNYELTDSSTILEGPGYVDSTIISITSTPLGFINGLNERTL